jgi:hypothetical protein
VTTPILFNSGTTFIWRETGGNGLVTLKGLGALAARVGERVNLGVGLQARWFKWHATVQFAVAPTAKRAVDIHLGCWDDEATPALPAGQLPATDTGYAAGSAGVSKKDNLRFVGRVIAETSAVGPFSAEGLVLVPGAYGSPFFYNGADQALVNTDNLNLFRLTRFFPEG